jgi:uncharacterized membrane protein
MALLRRLKGFPGHPSHPPLAGVSIGAYTIAVALLVLGALGLEEPAMAQGALLAVSAGLVLAPPTMLTGLLDWRELPPRTPRRTLANLHLGTMLAATVAFALSWFPARAGYQAGRVHAAALILALAGEALLVVGGYLGGTLVYVHGHRVLAQPQTPVGEALRPGRVSPRPQPPNRLRSGLAAHSAPGRTLRKQRSKPSSVECIPWRAAGRVEPQVGYGTSHSRQSATLPEPCLRSRFSRSDDLGCEGVHPVLVQSSLRWSRHPDSKGVTADPPAASEEASGH